MIKQLLRRRHSSLRFGMVLSFGAPLGWLLVSSVFGESKLVLYAYLTLATAIAFGSVGYWMDAVFENQELLANTDKLTGLDNRRAFLDKSRRMMDYCARKGQPVSSMFLDLDKFKTVNDSFGHKVGDQLLKDFASILSESSRASDFVARIGGDEFAVFLPGTDRQQGGNLANRIQEKFATLRVRNERYRRVTVSIGIHSSENKLSDNRDARLDDLIEGADRAMYIEKNSKSKLILQEPYTQ